MVVSGAKKSISSLRQGLSMGVLDIYESSIFIGAFSTRWVDCTETGG